MIRFYLLCWTALLISISAEEESPEVYSYYVGKGVTEDWLHRFQFDESAGPTKIPQAPFESRFFGKDDILWDLKERLKDEVLVEGKGAYLILNETTSRLVVKADRWAHAQVKALTKGVEQPFHGKAKVVFYEVPKDGFSLDDWDENNPPEHSKKLTEIELVGRSGENVFVTVGDPGLEIMWQQSSGAPYHVGDSRLEIKGDLNMGSGEKSIELKTVFLNRVGVPDVFELGSTELETHTLLCSFVSEIQLADGTPLDERILNEEGKLSKLQQEIDEVWSGRYRMVHPETKKVFAVFTAPPTLPAFLDPASGDEDPFSEDPFTGENKGSNLKPYLVKDERILAMNSNQLINLRQPFQLHGANFSEQDMAAFDIDQGLLFIEASEEEFEIVDAIINSGPDHLPTNVKSRFSLIEGNRKFNVSELEREDLKIIARVSGIALPGHNSELYLESSHSFVNGTFMATKGAVSGQVDFRGEFDLGNEEKSRHRWNAGIVLRSGQAKILLEGDHGEKWRALVVECRLKTISD